MKVLSRDVRYREDAVDRLVEEFGLVRRLGPIIDQVIRDEVTAKQNPK